MIIDFHTHAFPDSLAEKAVYVLQKGVRDADIGFDDTAFADGTVRGLIGLMDRGGISRSVLLPVATKASQCDGTNLWAAETAAHESRIIPFGAVYPCEEAEELLERLAAGGCKGIKLHGDFQGFHADDGRMIDIYRRCGSLGLTVVMHSGLDCVSPDDIHVTPERMANVLDRVSGVRFVLAHMGGVCCEDRAADILAGAENVWFDTAYTAGRLSPQKMRSLISAFGADRVLFASDSPWNDPADVVKLLEAAGLSDDEKRMIYRENACGILGISDEK